MSKLLIKKSNELLTLLDENDIKYLIDSKQNVRFGYLFYNTSNSLYYYMDDGNTAMDADNIPLNKTDVVFINTRYAVNTSNIFRIYERDFSTVFVCLPNGMHMDAYKWGVLIYNELREEWVVYPITEKFATTEVYSTIAYSNIGTSAQASQRSINGAINTKFGEIETLIGNAISYINQ